MKGYMHLSAPRNRYMHTTASKGRMLESKATAVSGWGIVGRGGGCGRTRPTRDPSGYLFMKVTMYMRRGVQIMGWSVRMAFMACFTQ